MGSKTRLLPLLPVLTDSRVFVASRFHKQWSCHSMKTKLLSASARLSRNAQSELRILKDFKCCVLKLRILNELRAHIAEMRIPKGLGPIRRCAQQPTEIGSLTLSQGAQGSRSRSLGEEKCGGSVDDRRFVEAGEERTMGYGSKRCG
jgi:hypothetical protein